MPFNSLNLRYSYIFSYVEALRCNLRENVTLRGIDLPALCCCGESVWDTNPDTCANNCVFYKNHKGILHLLKLIMVPISGVVGREHMGTAFPQEKF